MLGCDDIDIINSDIIEVFLVFLLLDVLINVLVYIVVDKVEEDIVVCNIINVIVVKNLVIFCKVCGVFMVYVLIDYVFNG